ncbi:hypothetical protein BN2476_960058 [Paraburkholderia piptadeniae]|uniref:Uncharacterized protein n=1 Tax=Paraburkholderia piptadeniae TaxID=1701573 RepID=A0A1N7STV3_9BURK|nr:hypothetical protein BN2476_960058 [Paraburkholderia piptadeniae]
MPCVQLSMILNLDRFGLDFATIGKASLQNRLNKLSAASHERSQFERIDSRWLYRQHWRLICL